VEAIITAMK